MGYYTNYSLTLKDLRNKYNLEEVERNLVNKFSFLYLNLGDISADQIKWYEHEKDLKSFSIQYPDLLFILTGIGEENYFDYGNKLNTDIWIKYFLNGKYYQDKLEYKFPEFNIERFNNES